MARFTAKEGEIPQHQQVFEIIAAMPGLNVSDIAKLVDFRRESVSARLTELKNGGKIRSENGFYFLSDGTPPAPTIPKKLQMPKEKVERLSLMREITDLKLEIEQLLLWQENAIKRYSDLAVKPEVLAARDIAIDYYERRGDKQKASDIRAGKHDDAPFMHMILAAMS